MSEVVEKALPEGWRWIVLEELVQCFSGAWGKDAAFDTCIAVPVVGTSNISNEGKLSSNDAPIRFLSQKESVAIVGEGDLMVVKSSGSASNIRSGKTAICPAMLSGKLACSNFVMRLVPDPEKVVPYLLWLILNSAYAKEFIQKIAGSSTYPNIKWSLYKILEIPLPPLPEQKRITAILTEQLAAAERARKASEARLEAARALPAAYLQEVFESEEAKGWPILKLGDISQVSGGIQKTPARAPVRHFRPYLTVRNVQRGYLDLSQVEQFEITESELEKYRLENKDILIVEGNGSPSHIGRNALFVTDGQEWIHQNHIIRVRIDQNTCLPEFASAYLNSQGGKAQMLEKAETTSGLYTLSTSKVGALELPVPPLSVQKRSIQDIYKHRKEITKMGDSIAEEKMAIDSLPASLLRQAFSGVL